MSDFVSLILYIIVFIVSSLLIYVSNKINKGSSILIFIGLSFPILLATFRYGVGTDYFNYFRAYNKARNINIEEFVYQNYFFELGDYFVRKIAVSLNSYNLMLCIYSTLTITGSYFAIKSFSTKKTTAIAFFAFLCLYFPLSLNLMTQFASIALIMLSYKYIFKKNFLKFSLLVLCASFFHTTAIIAFPVYFLWDKKRDMLIKNRSVFVVVVFVLLLVINYQEILEIVTNVGVLEEYSIYGGEYTSGQNRDFYLKLIIFFILLLFRKPLVKFDKRNSFFLLLLLISLIIGLTGFNSPWIKRIALYFEITQIFLLISLIEIYSDKKARFAYKANIIIYSISYFFVVYYLLDQADLIPYALNIF